jgi:phenylacetate-coenzyme A ligase PaaK-like adenylate-forming protein
VSLAKKAGRFYKKHLEGVSARSLKSMDDVTDLPFTFPLDIQKNSHEFLCVSQDEISRIVTLETSGTTALPKRIFFTDSDIEETIHFFGLVLSQLMQSGETALVLLPGDTPAGAGDLLKTAVGQIGGKAIVPGIIRDFNQTNLLIHTHTHTPLVIIGMPVQVLALCEWFRQKKTVPDFVRHVILTSDYASPAVKYRIKQVLNCRVFDHYGMTESGFGGGIDCSAHRGYHLRETALFFEIIDPGTDRPLPKGHWGEVTLTTLGRVGMPLIRYRTGDMSRLLREPCACGSPFQRMDYIRNRYSQTIPLPGGHRFGMPDLDDMFFTIPGVADFDALLVSRQGRLYLDVILKGFDTSLIPEIDIQRLLPLSPVLEKAVEQKVIQFGSIHLKRFQSVDTYTGKRRINVQAGPGKRPAEPVQAAGFFPPDPPI